MRAILHYFLRSHSDLNLSLVTMCAIKIIFDGLTIWENDMFALVVVMSNSKPNEEVVT